MYDPASNNTTWRLIPTARHGEEAMRVHSRTRSRQVRIPRPTAVACGRAVALLLGLQLAIAHAADATLLTASHVNPPGEPTFEAFARMSKRLKDTGSALDLRLFPRGQVGDEKDIIEQVRLGALTMAAVSTAALSAFAPSAGVLDIPFLIRDHDRHPWAVSDGPVGEGIARRIEREAGVAVLGWWSAGMRHVFTRKTPVHSAGDLQGLKVRVIGSPVYRDTFNVIGAKATPMPYAEVYTALATGTIDAAENDTTNYRNLKFYEQAPQLSLTGHFFLFKVLIANRERLARMTAAQREAFDAAFLDATAYQRSLSAWKFDADLKWLEQNTSVTVTRPDRALLEAAVRPVQEKYAKRFGQELVDAIREAR
jgi:tripartite ATP-independent transporter DctP family solute receptor